MGTSFAAGANHQVTVGANAGGGLKFNSGVQHFSQQPKPQESEGFQMGNDMSLVSKNNDTKMRDNEAFMAYMSKAEMGDDDEDDE